MIKLNRQSARRAARAKFQPLIQDAGSSRTEKLCVPVYHTHGFRQYMGTCKFHADLCCRHLRQWKPGYGLGKTIMREWEKSLDTIPLFSRCKSCWPNIRARAKLAAGKQVVVHRGRYKCSMAAVSRKVDYGKIH